MLKYKLVKVDFDKLEDAQKALYKQDGDDYILEVEGATSKTKLEEFRANNVLLTENAKKFENIDLDKYKQFQETDRKLRDKELIDKGDFETLVSERLAAHTSDANAKIETANNLAAETTLKYNTLIDKVEIEGAATKAFASHKIRPDAQSLIMADIKSRFSVDNGAVIGKDGDKIMTGKDGNLTVDEFVSNQPEFTRVPNNSGGGNGNEGDNTPGMNKGNTSTDRIANGLKALQAG